VSVALKSCEAIMARIPLITLPAALNLSGSADCCPLCGGPNECQLCPSAAYKGQCWCVSVNIPDELIARVPVEFRRRSCICRNCVNAFHRERTGQPPALAEGDFYFDRGLMVFTAAYLRRRGYCCQNNCRHCPYREPGA
jgi:hypothetical protein